MELHSSDLKNNFPVVMKNKINNWNILNYTKEDWCNIFKEKPLKFRKGYKKLSETPNWEQLCESEELMLETFFELSSKNLNYWLYYDYKYIRDVLPEKAKFINDLKWSDVGLTGLSEEESVLWIGNEGAHTPCHQDTYGCNLVAQLHGRKLWILMPPTETENLKPVRVPYEESSIYSLLNFYTPKDNLKNIREAYKVVLSPGDVLYVPQHWWHYVENLEAAISINIWIPLDEDHESRVEESLVRHYISNICQDLTEEEAKQILNPNEYSLISEPCTIHLIQRCLENYNKYKKESELNKKEKIKLSIQGELAEVDKLCMEMYIKEKSVLHQNLSKSEESSNLNPKLNIAKTLINTYCAQNNISLIKKLLLEQ